MWCPVTYHRVKGNYCLWHEGVQDVINVFSEKEPFGVDMGSHLQNKKNELDVSVE